jgi:hypothetical protein
MRRRELITFLGSVAVCPLTARAQQSATPVVGFLSTRSANESASVVTARAGDQSQDRESGRPRHSAYHARPRRRGDRIRTFFAAVHESAFGT